jgi:hypothetical protein
MPYNKRFFISGSTFWGWKTKIDLETMNNVDDIIRTIHQRLLTWIETLERTTEQTDLYGLRRAADTFGRSVHLHHMSFEDMLISPEEDIYMCDCVEQ